MALTPEDILNKTFGTTQFRRGYDEREVDDFLDDIVVEMRRAAKEGDELARPHVKAHVLQNRHGAAFLGNRLDFERAAGVLR